MKILNEDYVGKTSNIQAIEDLFTSNLNKRGTINSVPFVMNEKGIVDKMESLIEKEFNFERVILCFDPATSGGGYTYPVRIGSIFDDLRGISYKIVRTKEGGFAFKDKRKKLAIICLESNMLENCSSEEVMSVLLHEIGHSFNKIIFISKVFEKTFSLINSISKWILKLDILNKKAHNKLRDKKVVRAEAEINKRLSDASIMKTSLNVYEANKDILKKPSTGSDFTAYITGVIIASVILGSTIILLPLSLLYISGLFKLAEGYKGELDADRFATQYGYSKGLASSLNNKLFSFSSSLNNSKTSIDKDLIIKIENTLRNFLSSLLLCDVHPDSYTRAKNAVKFLDEEIAACKDKRIKKELQEQKKETLQVIKDYQHRLQTKNIDTSLDEAKIKWSYSMAGSETLEERAK